MNPQESKQPSGRALLRHALIFGGAAGAADIIWNLVEFAFGVHGEHLDIRSYTAMVALIFPIAALAYGLMHWRDRELGGTIRFKHAFGCGLAIGLVYSVLAGLFSWVYVSAINPGFIDTLIDFRAALMQEAGASPDEIAKTLEEMRAMATPGAFAFAIFAQKLVSVFIIALFASVILRRRGSL